MKNKYKLDKNIIKTLKSIKRLDKDGYLYFMENCYDYKHNKMVDDAVKEFNRTSTKWIKTSFVDACSAFCAQDFEGNMLTGRAYDFGHYDKNLNHYGLNILIHTNKNSKYGIKYETIATTDVCLSLFVLVGKPKLRNGALDDISNIDHKALAMLPLTVTDGINEKGLTASVLLLPLDNLITNKKKEPNAFTLNKSKCKTSMAISFVVRYIIDNCTTVKEAEELMKKVWITRFLGNNCHIFVTDKNGNSRLFEWYMESEDAKTQKFISIKTNCATNFYQAFSTIPNGMPHLTNLKNKYNYGYSLDGKYRNTYDRFNTLASMLDFYTVESGQQAIMKEQTADSLLRTIALYSCPSSPTHHTQYSCLFNTKDLTQKIYAFAKLEKCWVYSLKKHKFI